MKSMKPVSLEAAEGALKPVTVSVSFTATPHAIEGGGYWAEITQLPGCVAQANTLQELEKNLAQAVLDWLQEEPVKTEEEAKALAALQGCIRPVGGPFPEAYAPILPADWSEDDE